jgi:uncharacterized protein
MYRSKEFIVIAIATLALFLERHFLLWNDPERYFITLGVFLFLLPVASMIWMKIPLQAYGFAWFKWPYRWDHTLVGAVCLFGVVHIMDSFPQVQNFYMEQMPERENFAYEFFVALALFYFFGEFFFRGYLLFGLHKKFGEYAILLQAMPFMVFHFGKPSIETFLSFFFGLLMGHIALRTKSFIPCFIIHWAIGVSSIYLQYLSTL